VQLRLPADLALATALGTIWTNDPEGEAPFQGDTVLVRVDEADPGCPPDDLLHALQSPICDFLAPKQLFRYYSAITCKRRMLH
jgi:hypothetical protein